jgi:hypothetical protein
MLPTYDQVLMSQYKRNQIEEAISRSFGEQSAKPSSTLRIRLKRLLDTDRSLVHDPKSPDPNKAHYAFYSGDSPGKGVEIRFSEYEAFALLTSLRLLQHGWPQSFAVAVLRRVRPELEKQHARILKQDPKILFDEKVIQQTAQPGDIYVDNTDPVFLTIVSRQEPAMEGDMKSLLCRICRGMKEVSEFSKQETARSYTIFDLVPATHRLSSELLKAQPRKRGRSS